MDLTILAVYTICDALLRYKVVPHTAPMLSASRTSATPAESDGAIGNASAAEFWKSTGTSGLRSLRAPQRRGKETRSTRQQGAGVGRIRPEVADTR